MAETLSAELALGTVNTETFRDLLVKVTASLDQLMIGTLDSFFVSWAGSSRFEIGLPAGWSIGNERTLTRLRRMAIQRLLVGDTISNTTADLATLIVQLNGGRLAIGLEKSIEGIVTSLAGFFATRFRQLGTASHFLPRSQAKTFLPRCLKCWRFPSPTRDSPLLATAISSALEHFIGMTSYKKDSLPKLSVVI